MERDPKEADLAIPTKDRVNGGAEAAMATTAAVAGGVHRTATAVPAGAQAEERAPAAPRVPQRTRMQLQASRCGGQTAGGTLAPSESAA